MAALSFEGVGKTFPDGTRAVHDLTLDVADGEFAVLVGPSGCGKTTALRMVAGLEEVTDGAISIGGHVVNYLPPRERDVAMVFQNYALYPQMTVFDNVGFGLRMRKVPKSRRRDRVLQIARMLGLGDLLDRKPARLSGGQRQRVAMGRAIAREPQIFLMDEPLSNLDAKLRVHMRAEIAQLQREVGVTTLYVTHDQVEAMTMGERIAVLRRGQLQQFGSPQELYDHPSNLFVASFLGSPSMNLLKAEIVRRNGTLAARLGQEQVELADGLVRRAPALEGYAGGSVALGFRPEHLKPRGAAPGLHIEGVVGVVESLGSEQLAHVEIAAEPVLSEDVLEGSTVEEDEQETLLAGEAATRGTTVIGRFDPELELPAGGRIELAVGAERLHLFDLETGRAIVA
jgi:multiple sugar transport system ATP-binding protein